MKTQEVKESLAWCFECEISMHWPLFTWSFLPQRCGHPALIDCPHIGLLPYVVNALVRWKKNMKNNRTNVPGIGALPVNMFHPDTVWRTLASKIVLDHYSLLSPASTAGPCHSEPTVPSSFCLSSSQQTFKNTFPKIGEINGDSANQFPVERRNLCGQRLRTLDHIEDRRAEWFQCIR